MSWFWNPKTTNSIWKAFFSHCMQQSLWKTHAESHLSASTSSGAELQPVARVLAGTYPSCWWREHAGHVLGTPLIPCQGLVCVYRGWIANLWVLDLQQGEFHSQRRSSVILKARWPLSLLGIHKTPSFGYGASSDFYWNSVPHMLPLLPFSSWLLSGLWMLWGRAFSASPAQRCQQRAI